MAARPILGLVSSLLMLALAAGPASAATAPDVQCNSELNAVTVRDVTVPIGGNCTLRNSLVTGHVFAWDGSYFQATHTRIMGDVVGSAAQTVYLERGSSVRGSIRASRVVQVFLFSTHVRGDVKVKRTTDQVFICGSTVELGNVQIVHSARNIMVGGPRWSGCDGNSIRWGDMSVRWNRTDVQLVVKGNRFPRGNLVVSGNSGPSDKLVQGNSGGRHIACRANAGKFRGSRNHRWKSGGCG